jgi:hypothetical protein
MHSFIKGDVKVKNLRFSSLPNIFLVLSDHLTIHEYDTAMSKVSRRSESVSGVVLANRNGHSVKVAHILVSASAELLVTNLGHALDNFLAISFLGLELKLLLEDIEVGDDIGIKFDGLDKDRGCLHWPSWVFVLSLSWDLVSTGTDLVTPFLETAVLFHVLSLMSLVEHTAIALVVLSIEALEVLGLTVVLTGLLTAGLDENGADVFFLVLLFLNGVVPSRCLTAFLVPSGHVLAEVELDSLSGVELVEVDHGPVHPLALVDRELPTGDAITASFGTVHFKDVHAGRELSGEVQFGGFTSLPDVLGLLLHDLTIEQD